MGSIGRVTESCACGRVFDSRVVRQHRRTCTHMLVAWSKDGHRRPMSQLDQRSAASRPAGCTCAPPVVSEDMSDNDRICDTCVAFVEKGGSEPPKRAKRLRLCDAAVLVLRESDNPAVMTGDGGLLHMIANRAGIASDGWHTEKRVLDALSRQHGDLVAEVVSRVGDNRFVRIFWLPECVP